MMRFRDIPQFFSSYPMYSITQPIHRLPLFIKEQEEENLILNPDFQRGHVWSENHKIAFLEFLLQGGKTGIDLYFNHPGWMSDFKGEFVCVDGLQRITAIQDFIENKIPVFSKYYFKDFSDKNFLNNNCIMRININNLKTRKQVLTWYLQLNTGGVVHSEEEINKVKILLKKEEGK